MKSDPVSRSIKRATILLGIALMASSPFVLHASLATVQAVTPVQATQSATDDPTNALTNYIVQVPKVNAIHAGATEVTGSVNISGAPAGTEFTAVILMPDGSGTTVTAPVNADGSFTVPLSAAAVESQIFNVQIKAVNADTEKITVALQVPAVGADSNEPIDNYQLPDPTFNPIIADDNQVSGHIDLSNAPSGGTYYLSILDATGEEVNAAIIYPNADGSFATTLTNGSLQAGLTYYARIGLMAAPYIKVSNAVPVQVLANALDNYTVPAPDLNPLTTGDTTLSGQVTLAPAPAGTTFTATVTLPDGTTATAPVNADGTFSLNIAGGALVGRDYNVIITATLGGTSKNGPTATVTANDPIPAHNPLADYTVKQPIIHPVTAGDTNLYGQVDISDAPSGTSFTATVKLPDGTTKTVAADSQGHFIFDIDAALVNSQYTVMITANNDGYSKIGPDANTTVQAKPDQDPLADYTVKQPVINAVKVGDTTLTGHVDLTGAPSGTIFTATITLPDGTTKTVMVNAAGDFVVTIPAAKAGDRYQVTISAQNSGHRKSSATATTTVKTPSKPGTGGTKPSQPGHNDHQTKPENPSANQPTGNSQLPETGDQQNNVLVIMGIVLMGIIGLVGWRGRKTHTN